MSDLDDRDALIAAAREAAARAYAPYSGLQVGGALLLNNGDVVTGGNVENASYGLTLCAETAAVAKIANEGWMDRLAAVAIVGGRPEGEALVGSDPVHPCGRCRQILNEAAERSRRSEEHTSELQSLMRISYAVFCLKKTKNRNQQY